MVTSHVVTPVTPNMVTQHGYAICGYGGYARIWLRHMVTPRIVMSVTPYTITPHGYAVTPNLVTPHGYAMHGHVGYAIHGYSTWLRYPVRLVGLIGNSSLHDIRNIMRQQKNCVVVT